MQNLIKSTVILWLLFAVLVLLTMLLPNAQAKDFDLSLTGSVAFDQGRWGSGSIQQPGGTHKDTWIGGNYGVQVKYNRWKFQPTLEAGYRVEKFDFSDTQAPVQLAKPTSWRVLVGVSTELKYFTAYGLVGISFWQAHGALVEFHTEAGPPVDHGRDRGALSRIVTFKLGAYRLFDIGFLGLKVGPEISTEIFTEKPGFKRCRNFDTNLFVPSVGLRVQW